MAYLISDGFVCFRKEKALDIRASFILKKWGRRDWCKEGTKKARNKKYERNEERNNS
jgi:hypothetical protein